MENKYSNIAYVFRKGAFKFITDNEENLLVIIDVQKYKQSGLEVEIDRLADGKYSIKSYSAVRNGVNMGSELVGCSIEHIHLGDWYTEMFFRFDSVSTATIVFNTDTTKEAEEIYRKLKHIFNFESEQKKED